MLPPTAPPMTDRANPEVTGNMGNREDKILTKPRA